jgi:hypothetical protein
MVFYVRFQDTGTRKKTVKINREAKLITERCRYLISEAKKWQNILGYWAVFV